MPSGDIGYAFTGAFGLFSLGWRRRSPARTILRAMIIMADILRSIIMVGILRSVLTRTAPPC
jgi:hypothetical protein